MTEEKVPEGKWRCTECHRKKALAKLYKSIQPAQARWEALTGKGKK